MRKLYVFGALFLLAGMAAIILMSSRGLQLGHVDRSVRTVTARCPQYNSSAQCTDTSPGCSQIGSNISGYCHLDMVVKVCAKTCGCCNLCGFDWVYNADDNVCYQIVLKHRMTWLAAREYCMRHGGDLLSISSVTEQKFISAMLKTRTNSSLDNRYWIGATDAFKEGRWQWTDNTPFTYSNWYDGEPNNLIIYHEPENCAEMKSLLGDRWNDALCTVALDFICEKKRAGAEQCIDSAVGCSEFALNPAFFCQELSVKTQCPKTCGACATIPTTPAAVTVALPHWKSWGSWQCRESFENVCFMVRYRECSTGSGDFCGNDTRYSDLQHCDNIACPAQWKAWGAWQCIESNNKCLMIRYRECSTGSEQLCGNDTIYHDLQPCDNNNCLVPTPSLSETTISSTTISSTSTVFAWWTEWGHWNCTLNETCEMSRERGCTTNNTNDCVVLSRETSRNIEPCANWICPAHWASWGGWQCIENGVVCLMQRFRECSTGNKNVCGNDAKYRELTQCDSIICPAHWTDWGSWQSNTTGVLCVQLRYRQCSTGIVSHCGEERNTWEIKLCDSFSSIESVGASDWEGWSLWRCQLGLNSSCTMSRSRQCRVPLQGCQGNSSEITTCSKEECPYHFGIKIDCSLFEHSNAPCTEVFHCTDLVEIPEHVCSAVLLRCPISCGCCVPISTFVTSYTTSTTPAQMLSDTNAPFTPESLTSTFPVTQPTTIPTEMPTTESSTSKLTVVQLITTPTEMQTPEQPSTSKLLVTQPTTTPTEIQPITSTKLPMSSTATSIEWGKWGNWWCKTEDFGKCRMFRTRNCTVEGILECSTMDESKEFTECKQGICGDLFNLTRCSQYNGGHSLCPEEASFCSPLTFTSQACDNVNIAKLCPKSCGCCENEKEGYIVWESWSSWACKSMESDLFTVCRMHRQRLCSTGNAGDCMGTTFETVDCVGSQCSGETSMHVNCSLVDRPSTCKDKFGCSLFSDKPWDVCLDPNYVALCPQMCACCRSENIGNGTTLGSVSVTPYGSGNNIFQTSTELPTTTSSSTEQVAAGVSNSTTSSVDGNGHFSLQTSTGLPSPTSSATGQGAEGVSFSTVNSYVTTDGNGHSSLQPSTRLPATMSSEQGPGVSHSNTPITTIGNVITSNQISTELSPTTYSLAGQGTITLDSNTSTKPTILSVCNFDAGTLCTWIQSNKDDFDWYFQSGPTLTDGTGPNNDHTLQTAQGKYLFIESSSPRTAGDQASIVSPELPSDHTVCLEFWYYMFGDGIGSLQVYVQDTYSKNDIQLLKKDGNQGESWFKASVTIYSKQIAHNYRLVITANVGSSYLGDTAIDDLALHDGACEATATLVTSTGNGPISYQSNIGIPSTTTSSIGQGTGVTDTATTPLVPPTGNESINSQTNILNPSTPTSSPEPGTGVTDTTTAPSVTSTGNGPFSYQSNIKVLSTTTSSIGQGTGVTDTATATLVSSTGNENTNYQVTTSSFSGNGTEFPVTRHWSEWFSGQCTVTCGYGTQHRLRFCSTGQNGDCAGSPTDSISCHEQNCQTQGIWSEWFYSTCSTTCGDGTTRRIRQCSTGLESECPGNAIETIPCKLAECQAGSWSEWFYGECSKTCGDGRREQYRRCSTGKNIDCLGSAMETVACHVRDCPGLP